ncbi:hypothetical protein EMPG_12904 [Blastomyces silverae]|uniref:Uncharacterized protein n=1 Tax=Blastomyces silverae TaxID=2060906 RepID=A0A0H1BK99_9EURO|nr:hypothetical protein EMPG_12904 [Blastomyces silverae]
MGAMRALQWQVPSLPRSKGGWAFSHRRALHLPSRETTSTTKEKNRPYHWSQGILLSVLQRNNWDIFWLYES